MGILGCARLSSPKRSSMADSIHDISFEQGTDLMKMKGSAPQGDPPWR